MISRLRESLRGAVDPALEPIRAKVLEGRRLDRDDGLALYRTRDVFTVGELANLVRERLHGRRAYYNVNRHINYTNYCVLRCKFCSFYRPYARPGATSEGEAPASSRTGAAQPHAFAPRDGRPYIHDDAGGYEFSLEQIVEAATDAAAHGATEVHVVGGLHPKLPFSFYVDMCRGIREACRRPDGRPGIHIKAFTAIEIMHFTRIAKPRLSIEEVLIALREAGLDSLPGGGAEIFDDRVHDEAFRAKVGEKHWFDVHRAAHALGIPSNATMLYGHVESVEERVTHLLKLRAHQDESLARGVTSFQCCIPLSFIPDGSAFEHLPGPTGLDDLRTLAISRLMLDNFAHVKAFWIMQTPKLSQVALNWGVDDFDGTVVWYDITKREGRGSNRQELTVDQIRRLILEAGCEPVERDSWYRAVSR